jgi:hypothetical protein
MQLAAGHGWERSRDLRAHRTCQHHGDPHALGPGRGVRVHLVPVHEHAPDQERPLDRHPPPSVQFGGPIDRLQLVSSAFLQPFAPLSFESAVMRASDVNTKSVKRSGSDSTVTPTCSCSSRAYSSFFRCASVIAASVGGAPSWSSLPLPPPPAAPAPVPPCGSRAATAKGTTAPKGHDERPCSCSGLQRVTLKKCYLVGEAHGWEVELSTSPVPARCTHFGLHIAKLEAVHRAGRMDTPDEGSRESYLSGGNECMHCATWARTHPWISQTMAQHARVHE